MTSLDNGDYAGLSAALSYWFAVGSAGMGFLLWKYRARFSGWWGLSDRDKADALLQVGIFGVMVNAALQRGIATYSFALQEWRMSPVTGIVVPFYLVWSLIFMACILWWICLEMFGSSHYRLWWAACIVTGAWLGSSVSWAF